MMYETYAKANSLIQAYKTQKDFSLFPSIELEKAIEILTSHFLITLAVKSNSPNFLEKIEEIFEVLLYSWRKGENKNQEWRDRIQFRGAYREWESLKDKIAGEVWIPRDRQAIFLQHSPEWFKQKYDNDLVFMLQIQENYQNSETLSLLIFPKNCPNRLEDAIRACKSHLLKVLKDPSATPQQVQSTFSKLLYFWGWAYGQNGSTKYLSWKKFRREVCCNLDITPKNRKVVLNYSLNEFKKCYLVYSSWHINPFIAMRNTKIMLFFLALILLGILILCAPELSAATSSISAIEAKILTKTGAKRLQWENRLAETKVFINELIILMIVCGSLLVAVLIASIIVSYYEETMRDAEFENEWQLEQQYLKPETSEDLFFWCSTLPNPSSSFQQTSPLPSADTRIDTPEQQIEIPSRIGISKWTATV